MPTIVELKLIGIPETSCGPLPQGKLEGSTKIKLSAPYLPQTLTGLSITQAGKYKIQVLHDTTKEVLATSDVIDVVYDACKDPKIGLCPPPIQIKPNHNLSQRMRFGSQLMNARKNRGLFRYITIPSDQRTQNNRAPTNKFY